MHTDVFRGKSHDTCYLLSNHSEGIIRKGRGEEEGGKGRGRKGRKTGSALCVIWKEKERDKATIAKVTLVNLGKEYMEVHYIILVIFYKFEMFSK